MPAALLSTFCLFFIRGSVIYPEVSFHRSFYYITTFLATFILMLLLQPSTHMRTRRLFETPVPLLAELKLLMYHTRIQCRSVSKSASFLSDIISSILFRFWSECSSSLEYFHAIRALSSRVIADCSAPI